MIDSNKEYVWGLDLSMKNTGVAIFENGIPVFIGSIPTNPNHTHGRRLKEIYDSILMLKNKFNPSVICIERGFSKFNNSTQAIYKVHGIINLIFYDIEQIYYPPKTIKECIINGKATKTQISNKILEYYPNISFSNDDESDAFAIALTYYIKERGFKIGK